MSRTYFGTDGIRGTVGQAPITPDFMLRLGHAVGPRAAAQPSAADGADRQGHAHLRLHDRVARSRRASPRPASMCCCSGPLPTPGVAYLTRALRLDLGVVISASHNPYRRQRHQVLLGQRREAARRLGAAGRGGAAASRRSGSTRRAWARRAASTTRAAATSSSARARCAHDLSLRGLKIVVDAAHGAAYHVAPDVFHELGAEVVAIGCAPDGLNINDGVGATAPAGAGRGGGRAHVPTTASRSTATPTGCRWSTPRAASTTATSCST